MTAARADRPIVTYRRKDETDPARMNWRWQSFADDPLPSWAIDVQPLELKP